MVYAAKIAVHKKIATPVVNMLILEKSVVLFEYLNQQQLYNLLLRGQNYSFMLAAIDVRAKNVLFVSF